MANLKENQNEIQATLDLLNGGNPNVKGEDLYDLWSWIKSIDAYAD